MDARIRKEIKLHKVIIDRLAILAKKKDWSVKKYIENVLESHSKKALNK